MSTESSTKWIDLFSCPCKTCVIIVPTGINKDNFIALQVDADNGNFNVIHKYNINTNKWTTTKCNPIPFDSDYTALDSKQNVLYYLNDNDQLMQVELNNNKITNHSISSQNNHDDTSKCIFINNELFIIGGDESYSISKWNSKTKQLIKISTNNKIILGECGLIYDNKTNSILIFSGYDNTDHKYVDYILKYDLNTNKCNKLPIPLPKAMSCDCCLKAINNSCVLIFGGFDGNRGWFDDIYIYSIKAQTIRKAKIKCPSKHAFSGITVNDKIKDEKCVFGFVRNTWKICKIENHYFPPFYLLKLMHKYYLDEWVYLLDEETGKLYKMSTLDIV